MKKTKNLIALAAGTLLLLSACKKESNPGKNSGAPAGPADYSGNIAKDVDANGVDVTSPGPVTGLLPNGIYKIVTGTTYHTTKYALGVENHSLAPNAPVIQTDYVPGKSMDWVVERYDNTRYTITNLQSRLSLTSEFIGVPASAVQFARSMGRLGRTVTPAEDQLWTIVPQPNGAYKLLFGTRAGDMLAQTTRANGHYVQVIDQWYDNNKEGEEYFVFYPVHLKPVKPGESPGADPSVQAYYDLQYNNLFTRYTGWNGGEGAQSIKLPDGRILWSFYNSWVGTSPATTVFDPLFLDVTYDRIRVNAGGGHSIGSKKTSAIQRGTRNRVFENFMLVQNGEKLSSFSAVSPTPPVNVRGAIPYSANYGSGFSYLPLAQGVSGSTLQVLLGKRMENTINVGEYSNFSFKITDHKATDIAILSLPGLTLTNIVKDKDISGISFGSAMVHGIDGYTYIYGIQRPNWSTTTTHVARVANGVNGPNLTGNWEYYNGPSKGWGAKPYLANPADAYSILANASDQFSVWSEGANYYLLTTEWTQNYGRKIVIYRSNNPVGPWANKKVVYTTPASAFNMYGLPNSTFSYNAMHHPELSKKGELVISYNVDALDPMDETGFRGQSNAPGSADRFRPYFVRVFNWK